MPASFGGWLITLETNGRHQRGHGPPGILAAVGDGAGAVRPARSRLMDASEVRRTMHPSHADRVSPTSPIAILAMVIAGSAESVVRTVIAQAGAKTGGDTAGGPLVANP